MNQPASGRIVDPLQTQPAADASSPFAQPSGQPVGPEHELWTGRTRWRHYAPRFLGWLALNALILFAISSFTRRSLELTWVHATGIILVLGIASAAVILGPIALSVWGRRYRLTTQRLFIERGILSKTIDQMELTRVEDLQIEKSVIDRLFRLGTIALLTTDVSDRKVLIEGVEDPENVAEIVRTRMRDLRGRSVFVENLTP